MSVNREILKLAIPSILANITVPIVGMVDIAVAGHLDASDAGVAAAATLIGGVAIGSMLFDLLYWNFGFLRIGTGGLTAQACGRGDMKECAGIFSRSTGIALACALVLIGLQWIFLKAAFLVVDCTPEVRALAEQYFFIRIWAAPATLSLMAFKGWFIGMQDGVSPMITDLIVNVVNTAVSIVLALGLRVGGAVYEGMGFSGIAAGTVIAQYTGLASAGALVFFKYRKRVFRGFRLGEALAAFRGEQTRRFFSMNADLFVRSLCFIGIYIGFTMIAAHQGDIILASGSILMKIMMLFSYFTDGFAYAGEALTGKYIGQRNREALRQTVRHVFIWSMCIAAMFMVLYAVAGVPVLQIMTSDREVIDMCRNYIPWLLLMPLVGCAAFTWDGIFVGATASGTIRNTALWAFAGFVVSYLAGSVIMGLPLPGGGDVMRASGAGTMSGISAGTSGNMQGMTVLHVLLAAYFVHLAVRTVYLTFRYRDVVLARVPSRTRAVTL